MNTSDTGYGEDSVRNLPEWQRTHDMADAFSHAIDSKRDVNTVRRVAALWLEAATDNVFAMRRLEHRSNSALVGTSHYYRKVEQYIEEVLQRRFDLGLPDIVFSPKRKPKLYSEAV